MRLTGWLDAVLKEAREMADRMPEYRRGNNVIRELRKIEQRSKETEKR